MIQSPLVHHPHLRQYHVHTAQLGPSLSQQNPSDWAPSFLEGSSIYDPYDFQSSSRPSTTSALRTTTAGLPTSSISLDIPPSLANFRTIAGGHTSESCEWSDTLPFLYQQRLHYTYAPPDKSPPSPHLSSSSHSYCIDLPTSDMILPHSSASPPLPVLPGPSTATPVEITQSIRTACASSSRSVPPRSTKTEGSASRPREKKHACWMCEKSFDRPSTLRKHLLVHTGEKAFVCHTCGRRFGVASNLNRHVKRCILKPVNTANRASQQEMVSASDDSAASLQEAASVPSHEASVTPASSDSDTRQNKRPRDESAPSQTDPPKAAKRRRRAPSPSQWIPTSLLAYNLSPPESTRATTVPLPPVVAVKDEASNRWIEERNSWDENVGRTPYHPCMWKGTLPGPALAGLIGKDLGNVGLVNGGTYVMGRLVMV